MHVSSRKCPSINLERLEQILMTWESPQPREKKQAADVSTSLPTYVAVDYYRFSRLWSHLRAISGIVTCDALYTSQEHFGMPL